MKKSPLILLFVLLYHVGISQCTKDPLYLKAEQFLYVKKTQPDSALKYFDKSIEKFPQCFEAYFNKAFIKDNYFNDSRSALEYYTTSIEINSSDSSNTNKQMLSNSYLNRAISKAKLKDLEGAKIDFDKSFLINSSNPNYYFNRGLLNAELKEFENAKNDFTLAIKYANSIPQNSIHYSECNDRFKKVSLIQTKFDYYFNRALAEDSMGNHKAAIVDFNEAFWYGKSFYVHYSRANSFLADKDTLRAIKDLKLIISYVHKDSTLREKSLLRLAELFYLTNNYKSSLKFIKMGSKEFPKNTEFIKLKNLLMMRIS